MLISDFKIGTVFTFQANKDDAVVPRVIISVNQDVVQTLPLTSVPELHEVKAFVEQTNGKFDKVVIDGVTLQHKVWKEAKSFQIPKSMLSISISDFLSRDEKPPQFTSKIHENQIGNFLKLASTEVITMKYFTSVCDTTDFFFINTSV